MQLFKKPADSEGSNSFIIAGEDISLRLAERGNEQCVANILVWPASGGKRVDVQRDAI